MNFDKSQDNPFRVQISFHKLIENLEEIALSNVDYRANYAKGLLKDVDAIPELRTGISDIHVIEENKDLIRNLLADLFPTALTNNEIKAVTIPFQNITFNYTKRFQNIINNAESYFDTTIQIRDFDDHQFYVMSCCLILNVYYGYNVDFIRPLFYDIPDKDGIMKHYRILYNADFIEIIPNADAVILTDEEVNVLINNYDNLALWKEKFPSKSWTLKGFGIITLFESTVESAISNLKTNLLSDEPGSDITPVNFENSFRSIFKIPDLRIGFVAFNKDKNKLNEIGISENIHSFLLKKGIETDCKDVFKDCIFEQLVDNQKYYAFPDIEELSKSDSEDKELAQHLLSQGIESCILAPVVKNGQIFGIIELVSGIKKALNSINANKLDLVMPYIVDRIDRHYSDVNNQIEAIIQKEYTAIHPSVYWKFYDEALLHTIDKNAKNLPFKEIIFKDVSPLYGQIDIKDSSTARNEAIKIDLNHQIDLVLDILTPISEQLHLPVVLQHIFELEKLQNELKNSLRANTESFIQSYVLNEIHPVLLHFKTINKVIDAKIKDYFLLLDPKINMIYKARKEFDDTLSMINKRMATILDKKQEAAQAFFPHYYERFKTDGVEHNLYIGASIAPHLPYNPIYLNNLRLWQLQTVCEMENEYFQMRKTLPHDMNVTSLILVFSTPISIRFRMDEKRFDVDGTYNARYEVVKKRIDKSNIKGTKKRIVEKGKITIVYSQQQEENEYKKYIQLLQSKNQLGIEIENFDVEDLQGVTGLKALRVPVIYHDDNTVENEYDYKQIARDYAN